MKNMLIMLLLSAAILLSSGQSFAGGGKESGKNAGKSAIVIASFGTTYLSGLGAILSIKKEAEELFPNTEVRLAFTSNIIRKIWHQRDMDAEFKAENEGVPEYVYKVKNVLGAMADLQNDGYKNIVVQPTLIMAGEEFRDVLSYVKGLGAIKTVKKRWKPFHKLTVGRPLTGKPGVEFHYMEDIEILADALKDDAEMAEQSGSALVYMGHGNEHYSTGVYYEMADAMNKKYPNVFTAVGVVEGNPDVEKVIIALKRAKVNNVILKPFMVVAGDHAANDMASDEPDSWKSVLIKNGFKVQVVMEGLGEKKSVRKIFIDHLTDAAKIRDLDLK